MPLLPTHKTLPDTATQGHPASAIVVTPAAGIASTDVQAALQELSGEIPVVDTAALTMATAYAAPKFGAL